VALDELLAALTRDAQAEADRVLTTARAEAASIAAASETEVDRRRANVLDTRMAELEQDVERALSEARLAARREVLEARERLLDRVFAAVKEGLAGALDHPRFREGLPQRLAEGLSAFGPAETVVVAAPPRLAATVKRLLDGRASLEKDPAILGVCLRSADGAVRVDATLDARLDTRRRELARAALRQLGFEP